MSEHPAAKRARTGEVGSKQAGNWRAQNAPWRKKSGHSSTSGIDNDDVGIFVTSDKGQEKKCIAEMKDLLSQYIEVPNNGQNQLSDKLSDEELDIEASIAAELESLKPRTAVSAPWTAITMDIPCVSFVRISQTPTAVDPVALVHRICVEAAANPNTKRSRYIKRLTPMSLMRKTLNGGLESICAAVLPLHFGPAQPQCKFAIRPTVRNKNDQLDRDIIIKVVAEEVAKLGDHKVDLTNYDKCILVDVYRNVVGMSVVGKAYEKLKRYNLAEIYEPGSGAADAARVKRVPKNEDEHRKGE